MRIALIFCPFSHRKFEEDLECVSSNFGVYPPLGLAYAASILEKAGHNVIIIDANALKLSKEETLDRIKVFNPQLLGFMLTAYMFRLTLEWIKYLKKNTGLPVLVGNINVQLYPNETLSHDEINYGIIGPAHESLPKLISAMENKTDISQIEGICYKKDGKIIIKQPESFKEDFNNLPFPARHLLPNDKYCQFISKRKNFSILVTTKGCKYNCKFCYLTKIPYTERDVNNVIEEIEECYYKYNVREIDFFEASLVANRKRTIKICKELIKRKLNLEWSCRARVDEIDDELLKIMRKAGCRRIYYGIESGDQEILNKNSKGITLNQIKNAIRLTKKNKIKTLGFFMVGQVGDTKETVEKTIRFMKSLSLDYIQVGRTIPKPCSYLDNLLQQKTNKDYWRDYVLGKEEEKRIPTPWTELTEEEKFEAIKRMYKQLYLSPWYILKTLLSIRSFGEFKRYAKAGLKFVFGNQKVDLK